MEQADEKQRDQEARKFDKMASKHTNGRGSDGKTHLKPLVQPVYVEPKNCTRPIDQQQNERPKVESSLENVDKDEARH